MDKKEKQAMYKVLLFALPLLLGGVMAFILPNVKVTKISPEKKIFRLKDIPEEVIMHCRDRVGKIADIDQPWNWSDVFDPSLPNAVLVKACLKNETLWIVSCKLGGYAPVHRIVEVQQTNSKWYKIKSEQSPYDFNLECD